jgi:hypothetical protein
VNEHIVDYQDRPSSITVPPQDYFSERVVLLPRKHDLGGEVSGRGYLIAKSRGDACQQIQPKHRLQHCCRYARSSELLRNSCFPYIKSDNCLGSACCGSQISKGVNNFSY